MGDILALAPRFLEMQNVSFLGEGSGTLSWLRSRLLSPRGELRGEGLDASLHSLLPYVPGAVSRTEISKWRIDAVSLDCRKPGRGRPFVSWIICEPIESKLLTCQPITWIPSLVAQAKGQARAVWNIPSPSKFSPPTISVPSQCWCHSPCRWWEWSVTVAATPCQWPDRRH